MDDTVLIELGRAAARIQKPPYGRTAANEELTVLHLCVEAATDARRLGQADPTSLVAAVAKHLERTLPRRGKAASDKARDGEKLYDACPRVAELFVNRVWIPLLNGHPPSRRARRTMENIYGFAFAEELRRRRAEGKAVDDETDDTQENAA